mmetsp:Transcript_29807/g.89189  ORF Transcript_29807/g.89189 Transcript_29807/m.89189 type:complete len:379 (+) Transcript_29807:3-1139(+)
MLGRLLAAAAAVSAVTTTFQDATILVDQRIRGIKQMNAKIVGVGRNGCATPGAHRLGRCVLSADERAAVNRSRAAPRNGTIVLAVSTGDCQGHFGLWHYLNRCVANLYRATGGAPAALALLMHTSQSSKDACGYNPCMRGLSPSYVCVHPWKSFLAELFPEGVFPTIECLRTQPARTFRHVVTVHTTPVSSPPLAFRDAGYKAFRVAPPTKRGVALRNVLHLGRSDPEGTKKALRTLADDRELERAFRRAGDFEFKRCCDWRRPDATANVMAAISTADVIVAMHGAALTHLIWAKPDAVVVELFAHRMSGLWYYEKYTLFYGKVWVGQPLPLDPWTYTNRTVLGDATADRIVRCVREAAKAGGAKPSCDVKEARRPDS